MERQNLKTKNTLKNSLGMIYHSVIYLILFEVIYKGLILIIFKPILEIIVSLFNKDGDYAFFINPDMTKLLLKSTGYLMILILTIISVMLVYYELSVILLLLEKSRKKEKIKLLQIAKTAALKLKNVIKVKNLGLALYILALIPILNIGLQSSIYPIFSIPHYLIRKADKFPGGKIILPLLVLGFIYLFVKLFTVLPIMTFTDKSFKEASEESFKTIKGRGYKIAFLIIIVLGIWLMLTYPPLMLLELIQFKLPKVLRSASNIAITLFTLAISPLIFAISLESYNSHNELEGLKREEVYEKKQSGYLAKNMFIILTLVLIVGITAYSDESVRPIYDKQLLIGHRGGDYGVENTIDTILYAGTNGADYTEIDVLLSKDNIPVVIHDNNLKRLADTSEKISNMTVGEVKDVTIEDKGDKDDIPLLDELSRAVKGKAKLLVEFKIHEKEKESIIDNSIEILEREGILGETTFQTAEKKIINEFNKKYEDLTMGFIYKGRIGAFTAKRLSKMPVDFVSVKESLINKKMVKEMHKSGKAIFTWTTNNDYKAERLLKLGVDGIITDHSIEMVELRDKYKDYNKK